MTVAVAALAALPASLLSIWGLLHTSAARHVVAAPRADRWHTRSTPLLGGSGIFAGLLVAVGVGLAAGAAGTALAQGQGAGAPQSSEPKMDGPRSKYPKPPFRKPRLASRSETCSSTSPTWRR